MQRRTVDLRVAGQNYRVVTTANDDELQRCVGAIEEKLAAVTPRGRPVTPQSMLLAAMALASEVEEARARADRTQERAREALGRLVERIDAVLDEPTTPAPPPVATLP